jgi:hypothetical protein
MRLSMQTSTLPTHANSADVSTSAKEQAFLDPEFVKQLLGGADFDPNDPLIQAALAQMNIEAAGSAENKKKGEDESDAKKRKSDEDK